MLTFSLVFNIVSQDFFFVLLGSAYFLVFIILAFWSVKLLVETDFFQLQVSVRQFINKI